MISFFANIFGYILNWIYNVVGNYGWAIIIFSIIIKLLLVPISVKQQKTVKKTNKIQEKMKEIKVKYKNNPEKLNEATMELYRTENMSPFSGCLSAIVQIILLFAVFYLVKSPLTYMKKVDSDLIDKYSKILQENNLSTNSAYPEIEIIREIDNLKSIGNQQDQTENVENADNSPENQQELKNNINEEELDSLYINMEFFGLNLAQIPINSNNWKAYIIPILYVIIAVISLRLTNPTKKQKENNNEEKDDMMDSMNQMNKNMNIMFPFLYLTVALVAPLGLALYWLMNSLLMIAEKLLLNKFIKEEEE